MPNDGQTTGQQLELQRADQVAANRQAIQLATNAVVQAYNTVNAANEKLATAILRRSEFRSELAARDDAYLPENNEHTRNWLSYAAEVERSFVEGARTIGLQLQPQLTANNQDQAPWQQLLQAMQAVCNNNEIAMGVGTSNGSVVPFRLHHGGAVISGTVAMSGYIVRMTDESPWASDTVAKATIYNCIGQALMDYAHALVGLSK